MASQGPKPQALMPSLPRLGAVASPDPGFRYAPPWAIVLRPSGALFKVNTAIHEEFWGLEVCGKWLGGR
jgi:hypothetical protein